MLGNNAAKTVKTVLGNNLNINYINLSGSQETHTSIIYLDCGDFHIVEGSHEFKLWIYMGLPSEKLIDYSLSEFTRSDLIHRFPREFRTTYPNNNYKDITHSPTTWQNRAIEFLTENGVELDLEKLFFKDEYRRYINRYGLPVVRKNIEEKNLLEANLLKALQVYQPITARDIAKVLDEEFSMKVDYAELNSKLFSMLKERQAIIDGSLQWQLND